jgi:protein-tyrosine kinase
MSKVLNLFENSVAPLKEPPHGVFEDEFRPSAQATFCFSAIPPVQADLQPSCCAIFHTEPLGAASDRFRLLRMRLREHNKSGSLKTLLITSPLPHDGKSTVAVNLATALSEDSKFKVLLIEADLHRPCLNTQLGLPECPGLTECLEGELPAISVLRRVEPLGWYLMAAGKTPDNPTELVQGSGFRTLREEMVKYFDWILIDSPPVVPLTDALSLIPHSDAALLVVRAGQTPESSIQQAITQIGKQHIAGIVFNGVPGLERAYAKYGYYGPKV